MKKLRTAVIGTGFIGPAHIEALRRIPGVTTLAVGSAEPDRASELADQYGIQKVYNRWEDIVADPEIDVIHNCTPNHLHFRINRAAILAGKHILSEKPLTMTVAESAALVALLRRRPVVAGVNYNYRFYPIVEHARGMVQRGELGDIYLAHGHYLQDWLYYATDYNWRLEPRLSGRSRAVADIGTHWCDLVQFISGHRIVRVCADLATIHGSRLKPRSAVATFKGKERVARGRTTRVRIRTEDTGVVMFRLDNGAQGVVTVSQVSAGRKNRQWFEIAGSRSAISWNQEDPNTLWIGHRDRPNEVLIKDPSLLDRRARSLAHFPGGHPEGYPDGLKNFFLRFYDFIRRGKDPRRTAPDFPTFADGHRENQIVEAVLVSNARGRWVSTD